MLSKTKKRITETSGREIEIYDFNDAERTKKKLIRGVKGIEGKDKANKHKGLRRRGIFERWDVRKFYGGKYKVGLDFNYLKVETGEGANGVYHILYFGDYIPQRWLSDEWEDVIGAKVVDIRATRRRVGNTTRLARYCITQYCASQRAYLRYSWSWNWVFKGFVKVWNWLIGSVPFFYILKSGEI